MANAPLPVKSSKATRAWYSISRQWPRYPGVAASRDVTLRSGAAQSQFWGLYPTTIWGRPVPKTVPRMESPRSFEWHAKDESDRDRIVATASVAAQVEPKETGPGRLDWSACIPLSPLPDYRALEAVLHESSEEEATAGRLASGWHFLSRALGASDSAQEPPRSAQDPHALLNWIRIWSSRVPTQGPQSERKAVDRRLRAALERARSAEDADSQLDWAEEVGTVVYTYSSAAIGVLRGYWRDGLLRGRLLGKTLEELGYIDEGSSHVGRRSVLVEALSDDDPDVRYAAAQGLVYLGDPTVVDQLLAARTAEQNVLVKAQIDDAISAVSAGQLAP